MKEKMPAHSASGQGHPERHSQHGYDAHAHAHAHDLPRRSLRLAFLLTTVILLSQLVGGLLANSLALFSEAGHVVTDLFALGLAWFAAVQAERPANARRTFGYHRVGILAALINAVTLIAIAVLILVEAIGRLRHPAEVQPLAMFVTPLIAIAINLFISVVLQRQSQHNLNTRAALLHVLGDVGASLAVIAGGLVLLLTGWSAVDPLLSVGIALLLAFGAWQVVQEATDILLEAAPRGLSVTQLAHDMLQVEGVREVHDLHVWTIASGMPALACHATIDDGTPARSASIRRALTQMLTEKYHIDHATIQFESEKDRQSCCHAQSLYCCLDPSRRSRQA
ncbi:cation diffusion facilitator family transporter [Thermogemmatispora sp.]|uniref:cation diffusion facilitator family transporter n=1 Tax=Thermogemmatispora sp. TaxID=1968838 RepID=UPI001D5AB838|nr:cation diffusion facilitator family transporter [Thermogemmatispora sp.]MBX5450903.1 cation transporter [Thermogemmatispora sp.]